MKCTAHTIRIRLSISLIDKVRRRRCVCLPPYLLLASLPDNTLRSLGLSSYYSSTIDTKSAEMINRFLEQNEISVSPLNTRVLRHSADDFEVLVASSSKQLEQSDVIHTFEGVKIRISYGDLSPFMQ